MAVQVAGHVDVHMAVHPAAMNAKRALMLAHAYRRPMLQPALSCGVCAESFSSRIQLDQHNQTTHGSRVTLPSKNSR